MKRALIIFTRVPIPGQTKTRMMPVLSPEECAKLHTCFLKDIWRECEKAGVDVFIYYTPGDKEKILKGILGEALSYNPQRGEHLGERMYHAIEEVCGRGYRQCVLIGTDVPEVTKQDIRQAFHILQKKDVVFGPTADGGYYLVGMRKAWMEVFENQEYGHGTVLENTRKRLNEKGLTVGFSNSHYDMDTTEDLQGYQNRARLSARLKNANTARYLAKICRISIIIPILNEEKAIIPMQKQLRNIEKHCEIIFVDGGSTDRTIGRIDQRFCVIHASKGRAHQMNEGAKESSGDVLFFLHCDSELPPHPLRQIRQVMLGCRAGCFGIAFHSFNLWMLACRIISNHRIKDRRVMFGDQGIFIDRNLFFDIGMFPEIPVMEDYQFSLNLKHKGVKLGMTNRRIYTSDRRFPNGTMPKLKLMWKMNRLRKMYRDGVPVSKLASLYEDVR